MVGLQHSEVLHRMVAGLEQYFGALVGANIYMTPPNAQGLGTLDSACAAQIPSAVT
jgi:hypothetical protein